MSKSISFTIPLDNVVLLDLTASLLREMAFNANKDESLEEESKREETSAPTTVVTSTIKHTLKDALGETETETETEGLTSSSASLAALGKDSEDMELDDEGCPWDARIHSSAKTKVKRTGAWKIIRGMDASVVADIKAQICPAAPPAPLATPVPPAPVPPAPPAAPLGFAPTLSGYSSLATRILELKRAGTITDETLATALKGIGIENIMTLATDLTKIPAAGNVVESLARS